MQLSVAPHAILSNSADGTTPHNAVVAVVVVVVVSLDVFFRGLYGQLYLDLGVKNAFHISFLYYYYFSLGGLPCLAQKAAPFIT